MFACLSHRANGNHLLAGRARSPLHRQPRVGGACLRTRHEGEFSDFFCTSCNLCTLKCWCVNFAALDEPFRQRNWSRNWRFPHSSQKHCTAFFLDYWICRVFIKLWIWLMFLYHTLKWLLIFRKPATTRRRRRTCTSLARPWKWVSISKISNEFCSPA